MNRKVYGILLLFVLIAPTVMTFTWLHHQKHIVKKQVKRQMINGIDKEELELLKFSKKEIHTQLRWEHSKEFEYKGQMYDIVEKIVKEDSIFYWCWWDHEETKLNKKLSNLANNAFRDNPKKQKKNQQLFSYLKSLYFDEPFIWHSNNPMQYKAANFYYSDFYKSINLTPPSPPPNNTL
ncbi:MAG: hypothetical protein K9J21_12140 [Bacteroidales bacterium]|nr:hypothetical protein [Bacteroidales bacterium]MCF8339264.1 hypothetical protein [Bacteroidales bacterium]